MKGLKKTTAPNGVVTHNVFENDTPTPDTDQGVTLTHEEQGQIIQAAIKTGTLRKHMADIQHAGTWGIDNIDVLFPDATTLGKKPAWFVDDQAWVNHWHAAATHLPFAKVRSRYATLTEAEARARGYITEEEKLENVFAVFARETSPQTVYTKQRMNRDDIIDIVDFDVVSWIKEAMRMKQYEELARAALIGDGRLVSDVDKIKPENIRPVWTDDDMYAHKVRMASTLTVLDIIDQVVIEMQHYRGAGNPNFYTTPAILSQMMVVRNGIDERMFKDKKDLCAAMMVNDIIPVPPMVGLTTDVEGTTHDLVGILMNPSDYAYGANRGGELTYFQQFDIDFNQERYLYESRVSGALTVPKAALVFEQAQPE